MAINNLNSGVGIQPTIVDAKGDLIVATGADAVNRLAVGTANQQLVVDSSTSTGLKWAAPAGLVLLNTTSFSGVSAQAVNSVFTSTYANYLVTISTNTPTADNSYFIKFRVGVTDTSSAYYWAYHGVRSASTSISGTSNNDTTGFYIGDHDLASTKSFYAASINIFGPNVANATSVHGQYSGINTGGATLLQAIGGWQDSSTQFDGFNIYTNSGNISGTVRTYGYN
jgi:hypothetical protein